MPRSATNAKPQTEPFVARVRFSEGGLTVEVEGDSAYVRWLVDLALDHAAHRGATGAREEPTLALNVERWTCTGHLDGVTAEMAATAIEELRRGGCVVERE